jgi:hypothetical protein
MRSVTIDGNANQRDGSLLRLGEPDFSRVTSILELVNQGGPRENRV